MAKSASEVVAASEKRRGIQSTSFKFTQEEKKLLDELADSHGGRKGAVIAGLMALKGGNVGKNKAVADLLRKLASEIDPK